MHSEHSIEEEKNTYNNTIIQRQNKTMSTDAKSAAAAGGGELRSRSSFSSRDNPQPGGEEDNVNQKKGWLRSRVSRFSTFGKRKSCIITGVVFLILATIGVLVSAEEIRLVSIYIEVRNDVHMLYLYCI